MSWVKLTNSLGLTKLTNSLGKQQYELARDQVLEWLGSSANIKEQIKMPRFRLKVHDRAKSFVFLSYTVHDLRNQYVSPG